MQNIIYGQDGDGGGGVGERRVFWLLCAELQRSSSYYKISFSRAWYYYRKIKDTRSRLYDINNNTAAHVILRTAGVRLRGIFLFLSFLFYHYIKRRRVASSVVLRGGQSAAEPQSDVYARRGRGETANRRRKV